MAGEARVASQVQCPETRSLYCSTLCFRMKSEAAAAVAKNTAAAAGAAAEEAAAAEAAAEAAGGGGGEGDEEDEDLVVLPSGATPKADRSKAFLPRRFLDTS